MIGLLLLTVVIQAPVIPKVIVEVHEPEVVRLAAGGTSETRIKATIKEGFRIQANPAAEPYLVPATLEIEADERVRVGPVGYPPGQPYRLRGGDDDLSIYEGTFEIQVPLEAASTLDGTEARVVLEGRLRYQACNEFVCLRPTSVPVRLPVRIDPAR